MHRPENTQATLIKSKEKISIGIVFSTSGPYAGIAQELQNGALLALSEVNADPQFDFQLDPVILDPGGDLEAYQSICREMLKQGGLKHVVGCYTSSSRKEVIPVFEKYDGLLWYPSHYEGFEHCNNVIYTGASPNQHMVPLMSHMLQHFGNRAYCVGSDYIWGWESNRIMRECVTEHGARDFWERYVPVGSVEVDKIIDEIVQSRPSYIFSSLIGVSSESFMRAMQAARQANPELTSDVMPVCSHTLSEPELARLAPDAAAGHIASSVYFQSTPGECNARFIAGYKARYGADTVTSADSEAAYNTTHLLARAFQKAGTQELDAVKSALYKVRFNAPQGQIWIDPGNNHCFLTPALAVSNASGQFDIFHTYDAPMRPDPYLVDFDVDGLTSAPEPGERAAL
ncbi:transporter substrate-binding domain-containing protein [Antarctobacter sp.]|uniref:transporter substrate-binding domain-containing protein n=1 Tax=Antarctobacter sp. TaxID=1872577 RepID=UPI002B26B2FC|nr:transporter substrate-binding domain-containing protein [Antarctobacter sp.]